MESYNSFPPTLKREETFSVWFYDIRVDLLADDELAFELAVRSITVERDRSQMRRCLRASLKAEKHEGVSHKSLHTDPVSQVAVCKDKLEELENLLQENNLSTCKDRLLHLGARTLLVLDKIPDNMKEELHTIFTIITDHLYYYFYKAVNFQDEVGNSDDDQVQEERIRSLEEILTEIPEEVEVVKVDKKVLVYELERRKRAEDSEAYYKAEIAKLEYRLQAPTHIPERWNRQVQTDPENDSISIFPPFSSSLATTKDTSVPVGQFDTPWVTNSRQSYGGPMSCSFSMASKSLACNTNVTSMAVNHTIPSVSVQQSLFNATPTAPVYSSAGWDPCSKWRSSIPSSQPFSLPIGMPSTAPVASAWDPLRSQPPPSNPWNAQVPVPAPTPSHRTLPVSKWAVEKYTGEDQGLNLNEFLFKVKCLALSERVSDAELFDSALHLFSGPALNWYHSMRSTGRLYNWDHLVMELRCAFVHPDLDNLVKMKVYLRKQQRNESFQSYYYDLEKLFRSMSCQIPEDEKMKIVNQNMRFDYRRQLTFLPIYDLPSLIAAGRKVDANNFSLYNKMFGTEKSVNVVAASSEKLEVKKPLLCPDNRPGPSGHQARPSYRPPNNNTQPNGSPMGKSGHRALPRNDTQNPSIIKPSNPTGGSSTNQGPGSPNGPTPLEKLIASYRPPGMSSCYNCGRQGHQHEDCPNPRRVFCLICGFKGFETTKCPYCRKNGIQTDQSRDSSRQLPRA